jgi:hypothetical protein
MGRPMCGNVPTQSGVSVLITHRGRLAALTVYLVNKEEVTEEFRRLDGDHDGFISRVDARNWPDLLRLFDRFVRCPFLLELYGERTRSDFPLMYALVQTCLLRYRHHALY